MPSSYRLRPATRSCDDEIQARNPSHSPFFFASLIKPCACFVCTPICLQKSLMTWEWSEMAFPRNWLNSFVPMAFLVTLTIGAKIPFSPLLPAITWRARARSAEGSRGVVSTVQVRGTVVPSTGTVDGSCGSIWTDRVVEDRPDRAALCRSRGLVQIARRHRMPNALDEPQTAGGTYLCASCSPYEARSSTAGRLHNLLPSISPRKSSVSVQHCVIYTESDIPEALFVPFEGSDGRTSQFIPRRVVSVYLSLLLWGPQGTLSASTRQIGW